MRTMAHRTITLRRRVYDHRLAAALAGGWALGAATGILAALIVIKVTTGA